MITIDREVVIARDRAVVFDYLADVANYPRWQPAIERAEQVTPGEPRVGTQVKLILRGPTGPTEILAEIVEFERPSALALRSLSGPADIKARCSLSASATAAAAGTSGAEATTLHLTGTVELKGFLRFVEGAARGVVEREMPSALAELASRIETIA